MNYTDLENSLILRAQTKADIFATCVDFAVMRRFPYKLGEESFRQDYGWPRTATATDHDCSGFYMAVLKYSELLGNELGFDGNAMWPWKWVSRPTARWFDAMSEPVDGEPRTGDCIIFKRSYRPYAHHVVFVTYKRDGKWMTAEARYGTERHTLAEVLARPHCLGLRRMPGIDLGEITMCLSLWPNDTGTEVEWLQQRLNAWLGRGTVEVDGVYGSATKYWTKQFQYLTERDKHDGKMGLETWTVLESNPHWELLPIKYGYHGRIIGKVLKPCMNRHGAHQSTSSWTYWHNTERDMRAIQAANGIVATGVPDEATWSVLLS